MTDKNKNNKNNPNKNPYNNKNQNNNNKNTIGNNRNNNANANLHQERNNVPPFNNDLPEAVRHMLRLQKIYFNIQLSLQKGEILKPFILCIVYAFVYIQPYLTALGWFLLTAIITTAIQRYAISPILQVIFNQIDYFLYGEKMQTHSLGVTKRQELEYADYLLKKSAYYAKLKARGGLFGFSHKYKDILDDKSFKTNAIYDKMINLLASLREERELGQVRNRLLQTFRASLSTKDPDVRAFLKETYERVMSSKKPLSMNWDYKETYVPIANGKIDAKSAQIYENLFIFIRDIGLDKTDPEKVTYYERFMVEKLTELEAWHRVLQNKLQLDPATYNNLIDRFHVFVFDNLMRGLETFERDDRGPSFTKTWSWNQFLNLVDDVNQEISNIQSKTVLSPHAGIDWPGRLAYERENKAVMEKQRRYLEDEELRTMIANSQKQNALFRSGFADFRNVFTTLHERFKNFTSKTPSRPTELVVKKTVAEQQAEVRNFIKENYDKIVSPESRHRLEDTLDAIHENELRKRYEPVISNRKNAFSINQIRNSDKVSQDDVLSDAQNRLPEETRASTNAKNTLFNGPAKSLNTLKKYFDANVTKIMENLDETYQQVRTRFDHAQTPATSKLPTNLKEEKLKIKKNFPTPEGTNPTKIISKPRQQNLPDNDQANLNDLKDAKLSIPVTPKKTTTTKAKDPTKGQKKTNSSKTTSGGNTTDKPTKSKKHRGTARTIAESQKFEEAYKKAKADAETNKTSKSKKRSNPPKD